MTTYSDGPADQPWEVHHITNTKAYFVVRYDYSERILTDPPEDRKSVV